MSDKTAIEWTDATWTAIRARNRKTGKVGWHCEHATTGCEFCYAEGMNKRLGTGLPFKPGHRNDIEIFLDEKMLLAPLRWKKPRMIFVCSMTDLFADFVPDEWIDKIFAVMALSPQHTFQVLTKRAARMREYFNGPYKDGDGVCARIADATWNIVPSRADLPDPPVFIEVPVGPRLPSGLPEFGFRRMMHPKAWPLPNVWLGVSTERQQEANERIPLLLQTPAAVRFISAEPLLGPIELWNMDEGVLRGCAVIRDGHMTASTPDNPPEGVDTSYPGLDWIICGGESGPNARPMHPDWARDLRDQCAAAGVAFFFKQWGEWADCEDYPSEMQEHLELINRADGSNVRVGKKAAGRLLDGIEHNAMPVRP